MKNKQYEWYPPPHLLIVDDSPLLGGSVRAMSSWSSDHSCHCCCCRWCWCCHFFPFSFSLPMGLASTALSSFLNWWRHHNCGHKGPFLIKTEFFPRAISPLRNFVTYQHCWDRVWSETEGCLQTENIAVNIRTSDLKCWVVMKLTETLNTHGLHDLELSGLEPLLSSLSSAFYITWSLSNTFKKS